MFEDHWFSRALRPILALAALALPASLLAQSSAPHAVTQVQAANWQHAGSDIPADPEWRTGTLPNGLRYAVRRNARPKGQISIRVRIDAGALMETNAQQGWAHLLEHMVFRGTRDVPDGEGIKIWQRLGASFGSDSNAGTSLTATTFQLDLPKSDAASYAESMRVLSDMMEDATIDGKLLATERQVVIAEGASRMPPLTRKVQAASRALMLSGLLASHRDVLGTPATLGNATATSLNAFYKRWYRPERAVVVVVGDADPALLEAGVLVHFGGWKGAGPKPPEPAYGRLTPPPTPAMTVDDPQASNRITVAWESPHGDPPMTAARVEQEYVDSVLTGILSRRLFDDTEKGGPIVNAGAGYESERRNADRLTMVIVPRDGAWRAALDRGFAIVNGLAAVPPTQSEVDQQLSALHERLARAVSDRETAMSSALATAFVDDVDDHDVTASRRYYLDQFDRVRATITPARVQADLRAKLVPPPRLLVLAPKPVAAADAVAALAAARRSAGAAQTDLRAVSLDEIKPAGPPGQVVSDTRIDDLGIERVRFANGVELDLKQTSFDKDRIIVVARVGHGALNRDAQTTEPRWSGEVLGMSGFGPFTREELVKLTDGRLIGVGISAGSESVGFVNSTNRADLADALRLSATAATQMRYGNAALQRVKDEFAASYASIFAQPGSVYGAFAQQAMYGGDKRFRGAPSPEEVAGFTLDKFQAYWQPQLAAGPIKLIVVGDFDRAALIDAVARSYGALPARQDVPPTAAQLAVAPPAAGGSLVLHHRGAADQAFVVRAFAIPAALDDLGAVRALTLAKEVIESQLIDRFREAEGGTYSPMLSISEPYWLPHYGAMLIGAQVKTDRIGDFETALDRALTDIATNGPSADALARARATALADIDRSRATNGYWLTILGRDLDNPHVLDAVRDQQAAYQAIDAATVKAAVAHYLKPGASGSYEIKVVPEAK